MMSALSVLYLVLPFPLLFILHEVEEICVQRRWMSAHKELLASRFPKMRPVIERLSRLDTKAFALAALEETVVLFVVTGHVLVGGAYAMPVWAALFMAFSIHLLVHVGQAILTRGYVPGLVTSLLLSPFAAYGLWSIWLVMSGCEMVVWGTAGVAFMVLNLRFAHWLGMRMS